EGVLRLARNQSNAAERSEESDDQVSMEDVAASLDGVATSAHQVRDHLTPEAWRALAALEQPAPIAQHLVNLSALSGVIHESVLHDRSWSLLMLGRRFERARFLRQTFTLRSRASGGTGPYPRTPPSSS